MMLGLLLARAGVEVVVLEKHADFLRDFRGDTVHPSTLEVLRELGLLDEFLRLPHQEVREVVGVMGGRQVRLSDFWRLPVSAPFVALVPQWHFLDFLAAHARRYPSFYLRMQAQVVDLIAEGERVAGVRAETATGPLLVRSDLAVGADGRTSIVRRLAGLEVQEFGSPIDVLWMRLSRRPDDPGQLLGHFGRSRILAIFDRGDYWQCAYVIPKGSFEALRRTDLGELRRRIAAIAPLLRDRVDELRSWDDVKLLTVRIDRLREWYRPGLLCIGDAAHAMSPIGGVGINLAIQDAVAAANVLAPTLRRGAPALEQLRRVQRRRELPTRLTQRVQVLLQNGFVRRATRGAPERVPPFARLLDAWPRLRRIPGRLVGLGLRPEHVAAS
jgi:2-polyprenyl-6-methoxyphenol hydroxylase-like FAD-dependent oxidoreductase